MSELTAIKAMEALDKDRHTVAMTVDQILYLLQDFIPRSCMREAKGKLFDTFFINGVELTSNTMRKEYEQYKKTELEHFMRQPTFIVVPK